MEIKVEIAEYSAAEGIQYNWESGFKIHVENSDNEILIKANKAGLTSLAIQLLSLAQNTVPIGTHLHYDEYNSLEKGSTPLVIQRIT
jgi:hypothetical protein